jgi:hypothetical protein
MPDELSRVLDEIALRFGPSPEERELQEQVEARIELDADDPMPPFEVEDAPPLTDEEFEEHRQAVAADDPELAEVLDPERVRRLMPRVRWMRRENAKRRALWKELVAELNTKASLEHASRSGDRARRPLARPRERRPSSRRRRSPARGDPHEPDDDPDDVAGGAA